MARNPVVHQDAAVAQQGINFLKIGRHIGNADMFEHPDAGDLVIGPFQDEVVAQFDLDPVFKPEFFVSFIINWAVIKVFSVRIA